MKIGMLAAMPEEADKVLLWLGKPLKIDLYGDFSVKTYQKNDCEICFIGSGTGEIMAAAATQLLIDRYNVSLLINFGLCGSLTEKAINDICIVTHVVHYDYDISPIDSVKVGQYTRFSSPLVETDKNYLEIALSIAPELSQVVCASGDKFVADALVKDKLANDFSAQICDMESAGILFVTKANGIPSIFIKLVSDNKNNAEEFNDFVKRNTFEFSTILDKLTKALAQK